MFGFKKKNYLKRTDFINLVDSDKIWRKTMSLPEIKDLLEFFEKEISKYDFEEDKNFVMDSRREGLKNMIDERLTKYKTDKDDDVLESLFNFWEFVNNEYPAITVELLQRLKKSVVELDNMCKKYTENGIICKQEKDAILEMIQTIKKHINERLK